MSYYQPGAPPPLDGHDQPAARAAPPWWRGRIVVGVLGLTVGTLLGAAIAVDPQTTTEAGAAPEPAPTATVTETETETEPVPEERIDELDDREGALEARQGRLDDREDALGERQDELDGRDADLDERKAALDEREDGRDERDSAITEAEDEVAANTIDADGLYVVGEEIEPGTYRTDGTGDGCYWARLSGLSGELDDVIANGVGADNTTVEIQESDVAFETQRCGDWGKVS